MLITAEWYEIEGADHFGNATYHLDLLYDVEPEYRMVNKTLPTGEFTVLNIKNFNDGEMLGVSGELGLPESMKVYDYKDIKIALIPLSSVLEPKDYNLKLTTELGQTGSAKINVARRERGLRPANSPWLWSPGRKPALPSFSEKWGIKAAIVSAVDLIKGIGICAGCTVLDVEGATGNFHTNYTGKANAAIEAFRDHDLVYIHVEAPDECGHRGEWDVKVHAIEKIDSLVLAPVYEYLKNSGEDLKILVLPDHPTPIETRTHAMEPVPFFIYDSREDKAGVSVYTEDTCEAADFYISDGSTLLSHLIEK